MHPFFKIINYNFSPGKIGMLNWWADEMFKELDEENVENLAHNMKVFDWETDWDFPEPPDICHT